MARCELSGKSPVVKNKVSHSNIKTKSTAMPNIQRKKVHSQILGQQFQFRVATSTLRTMEHCGGFDKYILNQNSAQLSKRAQALQSRIRRKISGSKAKSQEPEKQPKGESL